ncbi:MAG: mechanosensitive ion channel family protein [Desulfobulbaceae bacterium]|nr:mechanosensitive ion channel family protein [Desulfobulbaceae bacterium]
MEIFHFIDELLDIPMQLFANNHFAQRMLIIFSYAVLAKITDLFVDKLLKRLADRTRIKADDHIIKALHRPICLSILFFGLLHALIIPPPIPPPFYSILENVFKTLLLIIWWSVIVVELKGFKEASIAGYLQKKNIDRDLFLLIKNVVLVLIVFAGIAWVLIIWDVNLTPFFASAGIAGIAIALAAKDTMANFFGGISLFADRAYKVGDYIILDSGERGEVVDMGIRSTKIKTRDDIMISIPNSILANSMIINESAPEPRFRIRIDVGVAYGSDLNKVEEILLRVAEENDTLARIPEPRARVRAFADSAVNFQLLVWVRDPSEKGRQIHHMLKKIYAAFAREGITIPFPQRDVHIQRTGDDSEDKAQKTEDKKQNMSTGPSFP